MRNRYLQPGLPAMIAVLCLLAASPGLGASMNAWGGSLSFGYDSFIDRFTILEDDTTDTVQELHITLDNSLSWKGRSTRLSFNNNFRIGNQTLAENLFTNFTVGAGSRATLELRNITTYRHYLEGSDYEFGNDYAQSNTSLKIGGRLSPAVRIAARGRMEFIDYSDRTDFDYDYRYADGGLELEAGSYFGRFARLAASAGHREVPDTTALNYDRFLADMEFHLAPAENYLLEVSASGDRRSYGAIVERSVWYVYSQAGLAFDSGGTGAYALKLESELYLYDRPSTTFFDTHFLRGGFRATRAAAGRWSVFAEPRYARMLCESFAEERYEESSIVLGVELLGAADYWLSLSWEPGRRNYSLEDNEIYSDFYINRLNLSGNVAAPKGFSFTLFVIHDPEKHARRDDDFSMTMVSAAVTKRF